MSAVPSAAQRGGSQQAVVEAALVLLERMGSYYGNSGPGMMGSSSYGSYGWMMSQAGYQWMTGSGTASPGWMTGTLPAVMMGGQVMGTGTDPGQVMGRLWANAPVPGSAPPRPPRWAARSRPALRSARRATPSPSRRPRSG